MRVDISLNSELLQLLSDARRGNPCASERLVETASMPLLRMMKRRYLTVPEEAMRDAVAGAVLHALMHPQPHIEAHYSPIDYLLRIANRRLQHKLRSERKRTTIPLYELGDDHKVPNSNSPANYDEMPPSRSDADFSGLSFLPEDLRETVNELFPSKQDQELLELIMSDDFTRDKAVVILGVEALPPKEQQAVVKRNRNRILGRLRKGRSQSKEGVDGSSDD